MEEEMVKYVDSQSHRVVGPSKMVPSASTNLQDPLAPLAPTGTLKRRTTKKDVPASIPVKKEDDDEIVVYGDIPPGAYSVRCVILEHRIDFIDRYCH